MAVPVSSNWHYSHVIEGGQDFPGCAEDKPCLTNTYIPVGFWWAISTTVIFTFPSEARRLGLSQDNLREKQNDGLFSLKMEDNVSQVMIKPGPMPS